MQLQFYGDAPCVRKPQRTKPPKSKARATKRKPKPILPKGWEPPQSCRTGWLPRFLAHFIPATVDSGDEWATPIGPCGPVAPPALWLEAVS